MTNAREILIELVNAQRGNIDHSEDYIELISLEQSLVNLRSLMDECLGEEEDVGHKSRREGFYPQNLDKKIGSNKRRAEIKARIEEVMR